MPDTISVFYYSQSALVLAINIPVLATAFSQKRTQNASNKNISGHEKCLRGWRIVHLSLCPTINKAHKIKNQPLKKIDRFFCADEKKNKNKKASEIQHKPT